MGENYLGFDTNRKLYLPKTEVLETVELNNDYILPDYIADITKLVRCESRVELYNTFDNGSSIVCEGEVIYNILVICEEDGIKSIVYSDEFNICISDERIDFSKASLRCKLLNPQVRLTGPRKISCRSRVSVIVDVNEAADMTPSRIDTEAENVQVKPSHIGILQCASFIERDLHASHDIELSSSLPEVDNVIYCRVMTNVTEIKYIENKLALRGETTVRLLYTSSDGRYYNTDKSFVYSEFLDRRYEDGAACICNVTAKDIKVTVQNNSFGEMRILELDYTYDITHKYFTNIDYPIIDDMYSLDCDTRCERGCLEYKKLSENFTASLSINEIKEIEEEVADRIIDCYCEVISSELRYDTELKKYIITGETSWELIYSTLNEDDTSYGNISMNIPFRYEREATMEQDDITSDLNIGILQSQASLEKGRVQLGCELHISAAVLIKTEVSFVKELIKTDEQRAFTSPLILYYPKKEDSLWSVAKRYRCSVAALSEANSFTDSIPENTKVMIIPR